MGVIASSILNTFEIFKNLKLWLLALATVFFTFQGQFSVPKMQALTNYISPPLEVKNLTAGFSTATADAFWLRAQQDIDYCSQPIKENECSGQSWLFSIINLIVELDRDFLEAYYYGALALSILISDIEGASIIFDKGVEIFNKEWHLLYAAGYQALVEEKNKLKASKLYFAAAENGAPSWLHLAAGKLASDSGDDEIARTALQRLIETESNPIWIEKLKKKIERLESTK